MSKAYTTESIKLKANESLLSSKGFLLFTVAQDGHLECVGDTSELTSSERYGIEAYTQKFNYSLFSNANKEEADEY